MGRKGLLRFPLGLRPPLSGTTGFLFEALKRRRCAARFQHQPSHCPSRTLRPIASGAEGGGARPRWNDQWRDRVEPCPPIFPLDPQTSRGDSDAGQSLLVGNALQQSAPKCSCAPSPSQALSSICRLSPPGCAERRKRTVAKRASLANDT